MTLSHTAGRIVELTALTVAAAALAIIAAVLTVRYSEDGRVLDIFVEAIIPVVVVPQPDGSFRATARVRLANEGRRPFSLYGVSVNIRAEATNQIAPGGEWVSVPALRGMPIRLEEGGAFECYQSAVLRPRGGSGGSGTPPNLPADRFDGFLDVFAAMTDGSAREEITMSFRFVEPGQVSTFENGHYGAALPDCPGL